MRRLFMGMLVICVGGLAEAAPSGSGERVGLIGAKATDLEGTLRTLGGSRESRPIALVFLDTACPIANRMLGRLGEISEISSGVDVEFFGVISDPRMGRRECLEYVNEYSVSFPILFDSSGVLARLLQPTHVPESFVIDTSDRLAYRGRIDDRFAAVGKLRQQTTHHDLHDAVLAVSKGETPEVAETEPVGCLFEAWDAAEGASTFTYSRDVAPILNAHCVECHRKGEVAPFSLESYEDARRRARMIAKVCEDRFMPPWKAEKGEHRFQDERRLTEREIEVLRQWAQGGTEQGNPADMPQPRTFDSSGWALGEPDLVLTVPDFEIPANGDDIFHYFVLPTGLEEDEMIVAMDFRAGDPSVTHHSIYYSDSTGKARKIDEKTDDPGYPAYTSLSRGFTPTEALGGWTPGGRPYQLPEGVGIPLEAGSDVILEMHYHLSGKETTDASQVAFYFAKGPIKQIADALTLGQFDIEIPPGEKNYWREMWIDLPVGMKLLDIGPHMHLLGKEVHVEARLPGGKTLALLSVNGYDFRWQDTYVYADPVYLPRGTRVHARVRYDNSAENPSQPNDPPQTVTYGEETGDEMCFVFSTVLLDDPSQSEAVRWAELACYGRDGEGKTLDWSEIDWSDWEDWFGDDG